MRTNRSFQTFYLFIALLMIGMASCENVLDKDPVDSFSEEDIFQQLTLVEAFLYQCYDNIGGDYKLENNTDDRNEVKGNTGMREDLLSSSTDELLNIHRAGNVTFTKGTLTPSYMGHFGDWRYSWITWDHNYKSIDNVNTLLGGIDRVPVTTSTEEAKVRQIKAEAYFIRAFNYTNLLRSYGGVVIVDRKLTLADDMSVFTRSSLQETVDFILSDLEKAVEDLPLKTSAVQGRATKGAAAALKSRLLSFVAGHLTNGGYEPGNPLVSFQSGSRNDRLQAAKKAAKEVMDGTYGYYNLTGATFEPPADLTEEEVMAYAQNYYSIFMQKGEWNDEVIFGMQYLNKQGNVVQTNLFWGPNGYNCWGNNEPTEDLIREYEMKDGTPFRWDKYNPGEMNIRAFTKEQLEADPERNPYHGREPRFYASILFDGALWRERASTDNKVQTSNRIAASGSNLIGESVSGLMDQISALEAVTDGGEDSRSAANQAWNGTKTGYYLKKMLDIDIDGELNNNENAWLEMRYAEVLLDYTEACLELGEIEEGLRTLNLIRNRAGLPGRPLQASKDQAIEWYRHERFIEMMAEGDRWYCIRKWMIAGEVIKDFSPMQIYHFSDGASIYVRNITSIADNRTWYDRQYWLPISITEVNKAPQLKQNPGY